MHRRDFIKRLAATPAVAMPALAAGLPAAAAGLFVGTPEARALGDAQRVRIVGLAAGSSGGASLGALGRYAEEVRLRTSIDIALEPTRVAPTSDVLVRHPFAVLSGDTAIALDDGERASLKRFLELGGFLVVDRATESEAFVSSVRRELERLFPRTALERVSPEHVVYRTFYRLDYPAGRVLRRPYVEGLTLGSRLAVVVCHNDVLGALDRDVSGRYRHQVTPGGETQREMAARFAVNLLLYGLCLHYKDDQVHLDYLLRRRKWKIERPE